MTNFSQFDSAQKSSARQLVAAARLASNDNNQQQQKKQSTPSGSATHRQSNQKMPMPRAASSQRPAARQDQRQRDADEARRLGAAGAGGQQEVWNSLEDLFWVSWKGNKGQSGCWTLNAAQPRRWWRATNN